MKLSSTAFAQGEAIPKVSTCVGADQSPPLAFEGVPAGAKSLALIVDDPDAPDPAAPKMTWVHWVLYDLPPGAKGLPAHATSKDLPAGTREGKSDFKVTGWRGPCPPVGRHRYFFKLYALDAKLGDLGTPDKAKLEKAMAGHVIAHAELMGTFQK
ncbi:MAG: YbhB/YbcL family Raf kinase inhibitor-like protein [Deltaproteobacteria bacterium]|nr:YbhB/YbcL family Raf kinase inhibitor-like protein [Deltaproteobacteria bacterium]